LLFLVVTLGANSGWLYFLAENGFQWDGWVYRVPIDNPSAPIERLNFTIGALAMVADNEYVYWGLYNTSWYVARAKHDGTEINLTWLPCDGSVCGTGLIYNWVVDTINNVLWYQTQADYSLCALDLTTMSANNYGQYVYIGGGGLNGQMQLYRAPGTNEAIGLLWGLDEGESDTQGGCIVYMDITNGPSTPRTVTCQFDFQRPGVIFPNTNITVIGGYDTSGTLLAVDIFSGQVYASYPPIQTPVNPCSAATDLVTGDVYIGAPGADGDIGGVFQLEITSKQYKLIVDPSSQISCMACVCNVAVVRFSAPPPPPSFDNEKK